MRPTCPVCNSIQTKITAKQSIFTSGLLYKCKNCGHAFVLLPEKKKGGCLWSITKFGLSALFLLIVLTWLFREDSPQQSNNEDTKLNNIPEKTVISEERPHLKHKESIEDSQDMSDTLNIKTEIRNSQ